MWLILTNTDNKKIRCYFGGGGVITYCDCGSLTKISDGNGAIGFVKETPKEIDEKLGLNTVADGGW